MKHLINCIYFFVDLLIKSKSGTGKTLVFCAIVLEKYRKDVQSPQSVIIVPTREVAIQVETVLNSVGCHLEGFKAVSVIGGRDIIEDRRRLNKCKAIVGTLGRLLHLVSNNVISLKEINTIVLDEADKLMSSNFKNEIDKLFKMINVNRQVIASSATYANDLDKTLMKYMKSPIAVSSSQKSPILIGVKQFIYNIRDYTLNEKDDSAAPAIQIMLRKVSAVKRILKSVSFKQCILFSNSQLRAETYHKYLKNDGWTVDLIIGSQEQSSRTMTFMKFCSTQTRILIASDLMARGVDVENVNLVINLDIPSDSSTYLHRVGRCGRFGSHGIAITLSADENDDDKFRKMLSDIGGASVGALIFPKDDKISETDIWSFNDREKDETVYGLFNCDDEAEKSIVEKAEIKFNQEKSNIVEENLKLLEIAQSMIGPNRKNVQIDTNIFDDYISSSEKMQLNDKSSGGILTLTTDTKSHDSNFDFVNAMKKISLENGRNEETLGEGNSRESYSSSTEDATESFESDISDSSDESGSYKMKTTKDFEINQSNNVKEADQLIQKALPIHRTNASSLRVNNNFWYTMFMQQSNDINKYVYFASQFGNK